MRSEKMEIDWDDIQFIQAISKKLSDEEHATLWHIISKAQWLSGWRVGVIEMLELQRPKKEATNEDVK